MSRSNWIDTVGLVEAIDHYISRSRSVMFNGINSDATITLSNLLNLLTSGKAYGAGSINDAMRAMSREFIRFMTTADRNDTITETTWFDSDKPPPRDDTFINTYISDRLSRTISEALIMADSSSLYSEFQPTVSMVMSSVMTASLMPSSIPVNPLDVVRFEANFPVSFRRVRTLAIPMAAGAPEDNFAIAGNNAIYFGVRSAGNLNIGAHQVNVPNWMSGLVGKRVMVKLCSAIEGTVLQNVTAGPVLGDGQDITIQFPGDLNPIICDKTVWVSVSFNGGPIVLNIPVAMQGIAVCAFGDFAMTRASQQLRFGFINCVPNPTAIVEDFGLQKSLELLHIVLVAAGNAEIFAQAMNSVADTLLVKYNNNLIPVNGYVFDAPWYRIGERLSVMLNNNTLVVDRRRVVMRHYWVINAICAIFGRYYIA